MTTTSPQDGGLVLADARIGGGDGGLRAAPAKRLQQRSWRRVRPPALSPASAMLLARSINP
jgi:hypothetical protein